jgi:aryl-alcohol dehydrogenase-like predicted oxidoreductase
MTRPYTPDMRTRELGSSGLTVPAVGLGCMGMSEFYGTPDETEAIRTIHRALELGVTLLDTADMYGRGANEQLVGKALLGRRGQAIVATKFGIVRTDDPNIRSFNGRAEYVRSACDASLRRLGIDVIDLYQLHRVDPEVPIEETVGAMAELVAAGKVRYLGLSEAHAEDIRRAAAAAPIASLQSEYSIFERSLEDGVLDVCEELGIGLLAYAPLGRGMLTGRLRALGDLAESDSRRAWPRFAEQNIEHNLDLVGRLEAFAADKGVTAGQLALAWLLAQRDWIVPIPGTKRVAYLEENADAAEIELTANDLALLDEVIPRGAVAGDRYPPERMPTWTSAPRRG